jgi:outer membrane murein-binding lipoprotein Lpp
VYADSRPRRKSAVSAGNADFVLAAALLQLTRDVLGPLRSAGGFVAMASKEPDGMEARIARLESDVAHIRSDVAELKTDVRSLRDRMDARFDAVNARIDKLADSLASARVWALVLYIALAGALFGALARGFGWL